MKELFENTIQCPVLLEEFDKPLITNHGKTYEAEVIERLNEEKKSDPLIGLVIKNLRPNLLMKDLVLAKLKIVEELTKGESTELRKHLTCPLSQMLFKNPVVTMEGYTYEQEEIERLTHDPISGAPLNQLELIKSYEIYSLVTSYKEWLNNKQIDITAFSNELLHFLLSYLNRCELRQASLACTSFYNAIQTSSQLKEKYSHWCIAGPKYCLSIMLSWGLKVCVESIPQDTIKTVKSNLEFKLNLCGTYYKETHLFFRGYELKDLRTLGDYYHEMGEGKNLVETTILCKF